MCIVFDKANKTESEGTPVTQLFKKIVFPAVVTAAFMVSPAHAQYGGGGGGASSGGSSSGSSAASGSKEFFSYVDVMFNYIQDETDDEFILTEGGGLLGGGSSVAVDPIDKSIGGSVLAGFRREGWFGFELGLGYNKDGDTDVQQQSVIFNALIYPFDDSELYLKIASGVTRYVEYPIQRSAEPIPDGDDDFITLNYGAGLGYVFPMSFGDTDFGIRAEAVYLVGDRFLERENDFEEDIRAPSTLHQVQFNLGIRFPL